MSFNSIPQELRERSQFVNWKYEKRNDSLTKVPYNPILNVRASCRKPDTWVSFNEAVDLCSVHSYDGIGFVLSEDDPYCFIDLDKTKSAEDLEFQQKLVRDFDCYAERSPSGKGLHLICKGVVPSGHRGRSCEIYSSLRYMTMTGDVYLDKPISNRQTKCELLWNVLKNGRASNNSVGAGINEEQTVDDEEIFNIAKHASNAEKFLDLWKGNFSKYYTKPNGTGDQSAADFALIDILAFYSKNREQIKRMFRMSMLGRRRKALREDYLNQMIDKAFDGPDEIDFTGLANKMSDFLAAHRKGGEKFKLSENHQPLIDRKVNPKPVIREGGPTFSVPPGLTGKIAKFIFHQSYKQVHEISILGALGLMAGIAGKAYNISSTGLNLYLLLLADTGRGKEEMSKGINKLIKSVEIEMPTIRNFIGPADLASGQGLLRYMNDHPTGSFVSIFGEFGIKLKTISSPSALDAQLMIQRVVLDFYSKSGAADVISPTAYSDADRNTKTIHAPGFSMIGETVPKWFYDNLTSDMIMSGFLPRFCLLHYRGDRPPSNYNGAKVIPSPDLLEDMKAIVTQAQQNIASAKVTNVEMNDEVMEAHKMLDKKCDRMINDSKARNESKELWNRAHLKTMKIAALLAVGKNFYKPVIDMECWEWAEHFVEYGTKELAKQFDEGMIGEGSGEQEQIRAIGEMVANYCFEDYENLLNYADVPFELWEQHCIPYAYLQKRSARMSIFYKDSIGARNALRRALQTMMDNDELVEVPKWRAKAEMNFGGRCYMVRSTRILEKIQEKTRRPGLQNKRINV